MNISLIGNSTLRIAIQRNLVSFPSQMPCLRSRTDGNRQERIAHLYFVQSWTQRQICSRYGLSRGTVRNLVSEWRIRAVAGGYIQDIEPESLGDFMYVPPDPKFPPLTE